MWLDKWKIVFFLSIFNGFANVLGNEFQCFVCSSDSLITCSIELDVGELPFENCTSNVSSCFTKIENGITHRGCLSTDTNCDDINCIQCDSNKCNAKNGDHFFTLLHEAANDVKKPLDNDQVHPEESETAVNGIICYECDSEYDPNCISDLNVNMFRLCKDNKQMGCYHFRNETRVIRGCIVDLVDQQREKCIANDETCKTCSECFCNHKNDFAQCVVSNGEIHVPEKSSRDQMNSTTKFCDTYNDECFVLITEKETIIRHCLNEYAQKHNLPDTFLPDNYNQEFYNVCSSALCNNIEIEPVECLSCDSRHDECVDITKAKRKQCLLQITPSNCYHFDNEYIRRGCMADLDKDQRELCDDTDQCKKCAGNECNSKPMFQKCIVIDDTRTITNPSKTCKRYFDDCFIHVSNGTIRRGCISDAIEDPIEGIDIVADCANDEICETCSGVDECNKREIQLERCIVCSVTETFNKSQKIDILCSYFPGESLSEECPLAVRPLGCYLFQYAGKQVQRGCMSSLDIHKRNNCRGGTNNTNCKMCMGDNCNSKRSFQMCIVCNSESDGESCALAPWKFPMNHRTCAQYHDKCYTHIKNGFVTRDCIGDAIVPNNEYCLNNPKLCKLCDSKNLCNNEPKYPTSCISCDSATNPECATDSSIELYEVCPVAMQASKCYHLINETSGDHQRGCVQNLAESVQVLCEDNGSECKTCAGKNCNSQVSFVKCLKCDTSNDTQCAINPQLATAEYCTKYNDTCFTLIERSDVSRGCINENQSKFPDRSCLATDKCEICASTNGSCNNKPIELETCVDCDSKNDDKCAAEPTLYSNKICNGMTATNREGCYLNIVDNQYQRGCISDLNINLKRRCLIQSDTCKSCNGINCNIKKDFQRCVYCNSRENVNCSRSVSKRVWVACKNYLSTCVTGIDSHGHTHRRCSNSYELDSIKFPNNQMEVCRENLCNTNVYPANRLRCYECVGDEECDFIPIESNSTLQSEPCGILSKFDQCYAYLGEDNKMYRGCLTDTSDHRLLCERDSGLTNDVCVKCSISGCNNLPRIRQPKLSCVKCNRSEECAFGQSSENSTACAEMVRFGRQESCFTHFNEDEGWAERGCTLDHFKETTVYNEVEYIKTCSTPACNHENALHSYCVSCESEVDGKCGILSNPEDFLEKCNGTYLYNQRGCFTSVKHNIVTRGCIKDLDEVNYENCKKDEKCDICLENSCNMNAKSSSERIISSTILISSIWLWNICIHWLRFTQ